MHTPLPVELLPEVEELAELESPDEEIPFDILEPESTTQPEPVTEAPPPEPSLSLIDEILASIARLPEGVELPSQLFSLLADRFQILKGALLLFDALRLVYAPWASKGYDQTTLHRMRIPLGANESFNALANGKPIALADATGFTPYQQYFSAREFSALGRMILTPFIAEDKLVAVLLLSQYDAASASDEEFTESLSRISAAAATRINAARNEKIAGVSPAAVAPREGTLEEQLSKFSTGLGSSSALFMALSMEDYARSLARANEHLDPFRLHEDIFYFLASFVADIGKAFSFKQNVFLIGLQDLEPRETDLFLHQLASYLRGLFGGNGDSENPSGPTLLKSRRWPADVNDPALLLQELTT